jgi:hypothetical protein
MECKRKFENSNEEAVEYALLRPTKFGKREKLDKLVNEASLRVSNILECEDTWNEIQQPHRPRPVLVSKIIKVANDSIKTEGGMEPKWVKHIRKECLVQFIFRRGKDSPIGEIILTGSEKNVNQADYLVRSLLRTVSPRRASFLAMFF